MIKRFLEKPLQSLLEPFGFKPKHIETSVGPALSLDYPYHAVYERGDVAFEVPLNKCSSLLHFSYHLSGWHPFVQTLLQYRDNPELSYEASVLSVFYQRYQPKTVLEAFVGHLEGDVFGRSPLAGLTTEAYHPFFPWDAAKRLARGESGLDASHGHQTFGPVTQLKGETEFRRLKEVYASIKQLGYVPQPGDDGDIRGFFVRTEHDYRFVVRQGLHRTPALSVLGYPSIRVKFFKGLPRVIFLSDSAHWPQVRNGLMSKALAERIFTLFFEEDGNCKAERLGLLGRALAKSGFESQEKVVVPASAFALNVAAGIEGLSEFG